MSGFFWLTDAQMARLEPFFPKQHGKPRVDDQCVSNVIILLKAMAYGARRSLGFWPTQNALCPLEEV